MDMLAADRSPAPEARLVDGCIESRRVLVAAPHRCDQGDVRRLDASDFPRNSCVSRSSTSPFSISSFDFVKMFVGVGASGVRDPVHRGQGGGVMRHVSHGQALGVTVSLPTEDRCVTSRAAQMDQLAMTRGGRAAEEFVTPARRARARRAGRRHAARADQEREGAAQTHLQTSDRAARAPTLRSYREPT
ncbi:MAG: hypothetical protein H0X39_08995 [Actinobacteria bacterium]|nr:hypothetical protein [Actinomycetota bacterium]